MASTDDFYSFMSGNVAPEQPDSAVAAIRNNPGVSMKQVRDAGTRNVESMGQIGASWFDGIPQVYDDDQIAAAKSAISRAQTPEEVTQIIQGLAGQNHGGNVDPISNALGQMGVGYSSDAGLSDIGRGVRSMTGTLDRVDVPAVEDYERALQKLGNAIPNVAAIGDFAIPLPSGAASTVHLYKGAKALPGKVVGGIKAAPGKAADWYKGRYNAYSDRLAGKKPAASAETAAPTAERTAASETTAPAPRQEPAPAPRQESAPEPAPAPRQEPAPERTAPAEGSPELRSNADGTPDLSGAINGEGTGAAGSAPKTGAGEAAGSAPKTGAGEATGGAPKTGAGEAAGSAPATGNVPKRGETFDDVSWSNDIAARDQAADFVTSGKYGLDQTAEWYRGQLIRNGNLGNAAIDREIARFIQQFTGGAK